MADFKYGESNQFRKMAFMEVVNMFKVTNYNQLRVLSFHFKGVALMLVSLTFLKFQAEAVVVFGAFFALLTLPVLYLHLEYYAANHGEVITFEEEELVVIAKNGGEKRFRFDDIDRIYYYRSASLDKGGIPFTPVEFYHYLRVMTKSEEQVVITCLMCPNLDELISKFDGVWIVRKTRFFCSLTRM